MRAPLAASVAAALLACATGSGAGSGGGPDAAGARLYRERCASCHQLRNPADYTRERWAWAVNEFGGRARLSPEQKQLVLGYLQAHAKDAAPAVEAR